MVVSLFYWALLSRSSTSHNKTRILFPERAKHSGYKSLKWLKTSPWFRNRNVLFFFVTGRLSCLVSKLLFRFLYWSFLKEQEREARSRTRKKVWPSSTYQGRGDKDDSDKGPPGNCGGGPGFTAPFNRFVFWSNRDKLWLDPLTHVGLTYKPFVPSKVTHPNGMGCLFKSTSKDTVEYHR